MGPYEGAVDWRVKWKWAGCVRRQRERGTGRGGTVFTRSGQNYKVEYKRKARVKENSGPDLDGKPHAGVTRPVLAAHVEYGGEGEALRQGTRALLIGRATTSAIGVRHEAWHGRRRRKIHMPKSRDEASKREAGRWRTEKMEKQEQQACEETCGIGNRRLDGRKPEPKKGKSKPPGFTFQATQGLNSAQWEVVCSCPVVVCRSAFRHRILPPSSSLFATRDHDIPNAECTKCSVLPLCALGSSLVEQTIQTPLRQVSYHTKSFAVVLGNRRPALSPSTSIQCSDADRSFLATIS
jgi:hypothetical protein